MAYLRWLIQQEGQYQSWDDVSEDVRVVAKQLHYEEGMRLVLTLYKPACRCRQVVDGVNVNAGSLQGFCSFIKACEDAASRATDPIIQALLIHNAGSASASHNGNSGSQTDFNRCAREILSGVHQMKCDDWLVVWEKVNICLYEIGAIPFQEADFRRIIDSMERRGSKDTAGRREFLAKWLDARGRHDEAVEILSPVRQDTTSDPTQRNRALELLKKLTPF